MSLPPLNAPVMWLRRRPLLGVRREDHGPDPAEEQRASYRAALIEERARHERAGRHHRVAAVDRELAKLDAIEEEA